ncbi:hypothetical protein EVAR_97740_1 [Eumeta japonica]|uniref:Uncharacterized protein n=1 Tax=Eumeta variegata TaxID=151549 RepID=A0A4C1X637_EUMVA|nr:hypothetical protein EVAR_97740_1 [Eumeta japonica]
MDWQINTQMSTTSLFDVPGGHGSEVGLSQVPARLPLAKRKLNTRRVVTSRAAGMRQVVALAFRNRCVCVAPILTMIRFVFHTIVLVRSPPLLIKADAHERTGAHVHPIAIGSSNRTRVLNAKAECGFRFDPHTEPRIRAAPVPPPGPPHYLPRNAHSIEASPIFHCHRNKVALVSSPRRPHRSGNTIAGIVAGPVLARPARRPRVNPLTSLITVTCYFNRSFEPLDRFNCLALRQSLVVISARFTFTALELRI